MDIFALFNFPVRNDQKDRAPVPPGGLEATGNRPESRMPTSTASAFITPQVLAAYPLASGIVLGFWKGIERLLNLTDDSLWVCFSVAMFVAFFNYLVSISDPKLQATVRDKLIGVGFAAMNGFYLFTTAIGITIAIRK
jgi:hypothetical protein